MAYLIAKVKGEHVTLNSTVLLKVEPSPEHLTATKGKPLSVVSAVKPGLRRDEI